MRELIELNDIPVEERQVDTIYILNNGNVILTKSEFELIAEKFAWVNQNEIENKVLELRSQTDSNRKSIIAVYETGNIKSFPNISKNFTKYMLLSKISL